MYDPHSPYHHPPSGPPPGIGGGPHYSGGGYYAVQRHPQSYPHSGGPSSSAPYFPSFSSPVPNLFASSPQVTSPDFSPPHRGAGAPPASSHMKASTSSTLQAMVDAAALTASSGKGGRARASKGTKGKASEEQGGGRSQSSKGAKAGSASKHASGSKGRGAAKGSTKAKKPAEGKRGRPRKSTGKDAASDDEAGDGGSDDSNSDSDEGMSSASSEASSQLSASEQLPGLPTEDSTAGVSVSVSSSSPTAATSTAGEAGNATGPVPMTKPALTQAFTSLFSTFQTPQGATAGALRSFTIARRKLFKQQLGYVVANPEALLALLLYRGKALFKGLDKDEDKVEREMLVALFGGVLGKGPTQRMLNIAGWAVGRVMNLTKEGEDIAGPIKEAKRRQKAGKNAIDPSIVSSTASGSSAELPAQLIRQRNRICKSTGRSMHEEREIALKYFSLPQFKDADIMTIYLQYQFDTTGGDPTKHPPLSRAHFYSVAPEDKKRKRKPEVHRVECSFCQKPVRIKIEEVEEPGPPVKKKKTKKEKKAAKAAAAAAAGGVAGEAAAGADGEAPQAMEGKEEAKAEGKEEVKADGKEEKEEKKESADEETVPGPMIRRLKLEVVPGADDSGHGAARRPSLKRKREDAPAGAAAAAPTARGPAAAPAGGAAAATAGGTTADAPPKKKRGRPKKERPQLTLTQEMLPLLPPSIQPHLTATQQMLAANRTQSAGVATAGESAQAPASAEGAVQMNGAPPLPRMSESVGGTAQM